MGSLQLTDRHRQKTPRWRRAALIALLLAAPVTAAPTWAKAPTRIALVVGVAGYNSFPLKNSLNDADLVAGELKALGFQVKELRDPRRAQVAAALDAFTRSASGADAAVLYFSGHGMESEGVNYLLPKDAQFTAEQLIPSTLPASDLRTGVAPASAVRLVILDACRNNPLGGAGGGLARESKGASAEVVTLMAAAPGEVASDGHDQTDGPFALALVAALKRPGMTVGELPRYVQSEVERLTGQGQTPDLQGIWRDVNWSFTAPPSAGGAPESEDDRRKAELAFWAGVRDSTDPEDFRAYLAEVDAGHFTGLFRTLAFRRLAKLGAPVTGAPAATPVAKPAPSPDAGPAPLMADARTALARRDYAAAVKDWRKAADLGDAAAMSNLGLASATGYGATADLPAAAGWFKRSAERGNASGMTNYAALLLNGGGVAKDEAAGLLWLRRAAAAGSPGAMEALGEIYARGERVTRDPSQAALWMQRAVDAGDGPALTDLAYWYEGGLNVGRDPARAMQLYRRAALAGRGAAMVRLGEIYETGDLAPRDLVQAASWYQQGAEVGDAEAMRQLAAMLETGRGVRRDPARAIDYYQRAARAGDQDAQAALQRLGAQQ